MSSNREEFVLARYETYIEMGYPPRESRMLAESDYEYEYYDDEPEDREEGEEL